MRVIRLKEAMLAYQRHTNMKVTYELLSDWSGVSAQTLASIGSRPNSNATLATMDKICDALNISLDELVESIPDKPRKSKKKKKRSRKKVTKKR